MAPPRKKEFTIAIEFLNAGISRVYNIYIPMCIYRYTNWLVERVNIPHDLPDELNFGIWRLTEHRYGSTVITCCYQDSQ
jgi:hypothetical protein